MRLAWLCTDSGIPLGGSKGSSVHLGRLLSAVAATGTDVRMLVRRLQSRRDLPDDVEVEVLPAVTTADGDRERADRDLATWLDDRLADVDVLYERFGLHSAAGSRAARRRGLPHLVELNAPLVEEARRYRGLHDVRTAARLEAEVLGAASWVLAVSTPVADHARSVGAPRVQVVPNAADPDRFPLTVGRRRPEAVFTGTLRPWHGTDVLARAWEHLGSAAPPLRVVGDGDGRRRLESVGARVTGTVSPAAVPALLAGASIGLVPYDADSPRYFSPLKLFESMAAGLATVAADVPGVRDVIEADPDAVVVVPAGDHVALADAVAGLVEDPDRRAELGRRARALIACHHTWAHRATTVLDLAGRGPDGLRSRRIETIDAVTREHAS